jgi:gas vesicle protein
MPRQDTVDFLTAFAVGTVLGIGATLLLQPEHSPKQRVLKQMKPYRKQMKRSYGQMREGVRGSSEATADMTGELIGAGRELLGEFREEVADILGDARKELTGIIREQVEDLGKGVRKTRKKMGM